MTEHHVNTSSYYDEIQILKVWDVYVIKKNLQYWTLGSEDWLTIERTSLFNDMMNLGTEAGGILIKNDDRQIYLNSEGRSLSICGGVNNISIEKINSFSSITCNLERALKLIKIKKSEINLKHAVIFPYHITFCHWVLGVLHLYFDGQGNLECFVKIYNPSNHGGSEINEQVRSAFEKVVPEIFEIKLPLVFKIQFEGTITNQQNDGSSCGAIAAENGKGIIDGEISEKLKMIYEAGAKTLREKQLVEVNCPRFHELQKMNKEMKNSEIKIDEKAWTNMAIVLNESTHYKDLILFRNDDPSVLGALIKTELKKESNYKDHPLWKLLIKNEAEEFGNEAMDTLFLAKEYLESINIVKT